jgi:hypothetical protein
MHFIQNTKLFQLEFDFSNGKNKQVASLLGAVHVYFYWNND